MQKLHFSTLINAPKEKVWHVMLDDKTYRQWAEAFHPGSFYRGDWNKGSKILFIGPDAETGTEMGMVSQIAENRLYEFISVEHLGIYQNGVEDTSSEEAKKWSPAFENYTFVDRDGQTEVKIDLDVIPEYADMFKEMWPAALDKLKELAEKTL